MHTGPFWRTADKYAYVLGTTSIGVTCFIWGHSPHDLFYKYFTVATLFMIITRIPYYYYHNWQYYCLDYCYYTNLIVLYHINYNRDNDLLYKVAFLFTNGIVGVSIWLFRNSLVIHKIDYLISLFVHICPLMVMYTFKWFTLPYDATLPIE